MDHRPPSFTQEVIALPGIAGVFITRADCYAGFIRAGHDKATADLFAFAAPARDGTAHRNAKAALMAAMFDDVAGMRAALHGDAA